MIGMVCLDMQAMRASMATAALLAASAVPALGDCQCLAQGKIFHHGDIACLSQPGGSKALMQCGMVLNNSSWLKIQDGCPVASADLITDPAHAPLAPHSSGHLDKHSHPQRDGAIAEISY